MMANPDAGTSASAAFSQQESVYMNKAFEYAEQALLEKEVPIACVIVDKNGEIIAWGANKTNEKRDATRHAEMEAINMLPDDMDAASLTLYVTVEPCIMCAAALRQYGIFDVVYGCDNARFGGCGTVKDIARQEVEGLEKLRIRKGLYADRAIEILKRFYTQENLNAPPEKRKIKRLKTE
eukprot:Clim_evm53s157 gene=Clim_evmTU53s157